MGHCLGKRHGLGFIQRRRGVGIITAGIFALRSENQREKLRWDFVMLSVRLVGVAGYGKRRHILRKGQFGIIGNICKPPFRSHAEHIYTGQCDRVSERCAFCGIDGEGEHIHGVSSFLRGPGKKALTRRCRTRNLSPRDFSMCSSSGGMPETWTSSQYIMMGAASDAQDKTCS
ncbi:hypothetical protein D3C86_1480050 [compost metagenome]